MFYYQDTKGQDLQKPLKGIDHFVLVIKIRTAEKKYGNLVLVYSDKGEGRKKDFIFQNPKKERI